MFLSRLKLLSGTARAAVAAPSARQASRVLLGSMLLSGGALAQGLSGGTVVAGSAQIGAPAGNQTTITQSSQKAVIDWRGFSVGSGEVVRFVQPDRSSITLNRVTGGGLSAIDGAIQANGQVWLLNPNGVLVGSGGRVSAAGFLATTHALSNADFMAGRYGFDGSASTGQIVNRGTIAADGGYAVLAGGSVANEGLVTASLGQIALGAGKGFALDLAGDQLLSFAVTAPVELMPADGSALVSNSGTLAANGGRVVLSARAAAGVVDNVINTSGVVQATAARLVNGEIVLDGGDAGTVKVAGTLDASGLGADETGGRIVALGDTVVVGNAARLDARGDAGGGEIYVGGGWQGASLLSRPSAVRVGIASGALLDASAITHGDGGTVVAWSDVHNPLSQTRAHGSFYAKGGATGGNGGRIETSGHYLDTAGSRGSAAAPLGKGGEWLFDPYNITIYHNSSGEGVESGGSLDPSSGFWNIDIDSGPSSIPDNQINDLLSGGTSVTIDTTGDGGGPDVGNIYLDGYIIKSNGRRATLTLDADNDIIFRGGSIEADATTDSPSPDFEPALDVVLKAGGNIDTDGYGDGYGTYIEVELGNISLLAGGNIDLSSSNLEGHNISMATGDGASILNFGDLTASGYIAMTVGTGGSIISDGSFSTGGGNITLSGGTGSNFFVGGFNDTGGGEFVINAADGGFVEIGGFVYTIESSSEFSSASISTSSEILGGDVKIDAGSTGTISIGGIESYGGYIYAGDGLVSLRAGGFDSEREVGGINVFGTIYGDLIDINAEGDGFNLHSGATISGRNVTVTADSMEIRSYIDGYGGFITLQPFSAGRNIRLGNLEEAGDRLVLTSDELDYVQASNLTIGHELGTGLIEIGDVDLDVDMEPPAEVSTEVPSYDGYEGSSSTYLTVIRSPGAGGRVVVGVGLDPLDRYTIGDYDAVRIVAGDEIELAAGTRFDVSGADSPVAGRIEFVSGNRFINNAGSEAIVTSGAGQWSVLTARPDGNVFGGLVSGKLASWGYSYDSAAEFGLPSHEPGGAYFFSFSPTLRVEAKNRTKIYGDVLAFTSDDYTVAGLINALLYGNVFEQDRVEGTIPLMSTGAGATAAAGTYAIRLSHPTGSSGHSISSPSTSEPTSSSPYVLPVGYTLDFREGVLEVARRELSGHLIGAISKVYDGTTNAALTASNFELTGFVNGDGAVVGSTAGTYASRNVGTGIEVLTLLGASNVTATSGSLSNYILPASLSGTIGTITPATLTYVANPASRPQLTSNPTFSGSVTGFIGGDTLTTATTGTLLFMTDATPDSPIGRYAINGGGLAAGNYVFVQASDNATALTVLPSVSDEAKDVITEVLTLLNPNMLRPRVPTDIGGQLRGDIKPGQPSPVLQPEPPLPPPAPEGDPPPSNAAGVITTAAAVDSLPPTPVGDPPPTPVDPEDQGDTLLAAAEPEQPKQAPQPKRSGMVTTSLTPELDMALPTPPASPDVPGADTNFSGSWEPVQ